MATTPPSPRPLVPPPHPTTPRPANIAKPESAAAVLGREHVYYRSGRPSTLKAPGRILWYRTKDHATGPGCFIGTSLLDAIETGTPEDLYAKLAHYGVFTLRDIREVAGARGHAQALRLSYTEMFNRPVPWTEYLTQQGTTGGPLTIQGPASMPHPTFDAIYSLGNS